MDQYYLNDEYICNIGSNGKAIPFINDEESSALYQSKVYLYARKMIKSKRIKSVLDIGCGYGIKLKEIIFPVCNDIVGIDCDDAIKYCRNSYNFGDWYKDDIENPALELKRNFDMIISSDVIEHLVDPDKLLDYIKLYGHNETQIILSTPERDKISYQNPLGPPHNLTHVREWNLTELNSYFMDRGFKILNHFLIGDKILSYWALIRKFVRMEPIKRIQVIHCLKNH